jgi:hypothetical protein
VIHHAVPRERIDSDEVPSVFRLPAVPNYAVASLVVKSTPPDVFDESVRRAMAQYQCKIDCVARVIVEQSFDFTQTN